MIGWMWVSIMPGQHQLAAKVDDLGTASDQGRHVLVVADRDDGVPGKGDGLAYRARLVGGVDLAIAEDDIGLAVFRGSAADQRPETITARLTQISLLEIDRPALIVPPLCLLLPPEQNILRLVDAGGKVG